MFITFQDRVVEHYSGYKETDIVLLAEKLNNVMEQAPRFKYQTVPNFILFFQTFVYIVLYNVKNSQKVRFCF